VIVLLKNKTMTISWSWVPGMQLSVHIDRVAILLISLVTLVSSLVYIFSLKYMENDEGVYRYFAKLGLFVSSMIGLLIADHLILLFVFWELVGISSYLLIGFWYSKEGIRSSARMSFMVNRVADACLLAGILLLFKQTGELSFVKMEKTTMFLPSLLITIGAFGKSAQLPFSGWLIKAMVGPTPVSALIHAATMVAAGVYLLFRFSPLIHPNALIIIAVVGTVTALYGGICALNQFDIKKILAYSTISQLGYMMIGIGVGSRDAALFHLITHAFFKAGLFLAAASTINYLHKLSDEDAQDMRSMGGLREKLPWTFRSFLFCGFALAGVPLFSGFLSKDAIIIAAWTWASELGSWAYIIPDLALLTALLTAFYFGRATLLVFFGVPRVVLKPISYNESKFFILPLIILSILSSWFLFNLNPVGHESWLIAYWSILKDETSSLIVNLTLILSVILVSTGFVMSYAFFKLGTNYNVSFQKLEEPTAIMGKSIFHGFYLTQSYLSIGNMSYSLAKNIHRIDKSLINPFLNLIAVGSVVLSKVLALIDRFLVDGPVNWTASLSAFLGKRLAGLSARDLQTQLLWLLLIVTLILAIFISLS
ncbi:MAG: NADH-quinone oxidoreductase subunit L, partial [Bacteroidota bacterium]